VKKTTIFCIDHALRLVTTFGLVVDEESGAILKVFRKKREEIAVACGYPPYSDEDAAKAAAITKSAAEGASSSGSPAHGQDAGDKGDTATPSSGIEFSAEDILIAEAVGTLTLADQQYADDDHEAASRNYHTATVYFRVLESMVPRLTPRVHGYLNYAATRTQESSQIFENLIHEHFEGLRCVDFYEIVENKRLGKGSYGSVYLCRHRKTGDEFACKVIGMNRINSHYLRKLHMEIAIMKQVDHPNIIKLREVFFGSRTVYLVMELCKGGELFDEITRKAQRGLPELQAGRLLGDMFSAVKYLHSKGIAHRDLKLENFLFEEPGMQNPLKLIDFGLSKHFVPKEKMRQVVSGCASGCASASGCVGLRLGVWGWVEE
jgi:hypothetical protein